MRIAHVAYRCVPGAFRGGVERVVLELADAQARGGADVEILAYSPRPAPPIRTDAGVRIRYFPGKRLAGVVWSPAMARALRTGSPRADVVHAHNSFHPLNVQARRAAAALGIPVFFHPHGALDPDMFRGVSAASLKKKLFIRLFERPNLDEAAAVFALSADEERQLRAIGVRSPVEIVANGIAPPPPRSPGPRAVLRAELGIAPRAPVLLFVGRIVSKKRVHAIVEALALARVANADLALLLVGDPDQDPAYTSLLRALVAERSLERHVHWLGFADESRKAAIFSAADIFIHASRSEGMAMAILEAMAAGLPTLVTPGCFMSPAAAAGAVLETGPETDAIATGLMRLIAEPGLAPSIAAAGEAWIRERHGWPALAGRVLAAYERHARV